MSVDGGRVYALPHLVRVRAWSHFSRMLVVTAGPRVDSVVVVVACQAKRLRAVVAIDARR